MLSLNSMTPQNLTSPTDDQLGDPLCTRFQQFETDKPVHERLADLYGEVKDSLDDTGRERFDSTAVKLLQQEVQFSPSYSNIAAQITALQSAGLPLKDVATIFDPLTEKLAQTWADTVDTLRGSFDYTSFNSLLDSIEDGFEALQKTLNTDGKEWSSGDHSLRIPIEQKLIHLQCKTLISYMSFAISAHLTLLDTDTLSRQEQKSLLAWLDATLKDCTLYSSIPFLSNNNAINSLVSQIGELRSKVEHSAVKPNVFSIAAKVAHIARVALIWLPTVLVHFVPIVFSAIVGHKAGGMKGALIGTGVAAATSALCLFSDMISKKVVGELSRFQYIPETLCPTAQAVIGFTLRIQMMLLTMQANGIVSGMISKTLESHPKPSGVLTSMKDIGTATYDLTGKAATFTYKEFSLVESVILQDRSEGTLSAIGDIFKAQIEAGVAGYRLGEASVQLPIAMRRLVSKIL